MSIPDVENYWTQELGESVEIVPRGWADYPSDYALYLGGTFIVAYKRLEEVEDYLSRYFVLKGS